MPPDQHDLPTTLPSAGNADRQVSYDEAGRVIGVEPQDQKPERHSGHHRRNGEKARLEFAQPESDPVIGVVGE